MSRIAGFDILTCSFAIFAAGRVAGTALMYRVTPARVLTAFSFGGFLLAMVAVFWGGAIGAVAMLASSFFLSITWPTVLGLAIRGYGPLMKLGTALVCMGGAAGGVAFSLITARWKFSSVHLAMLVPAFSYAVLVAFAAVSERQRRAANASCKI